jgi:hypothetical protein
MNTSSLALKLGRWVEVPAIHNLTKFHVDIVSRYRDIAFLLSSAMPICSLYFSALNPYLRFFPLSVPEIFSTYTTRDLSLSL